MLLLFAALACTKEEPQDSDSPTEGCGDLATVTGVLTDDAGAVVSGGTVRAWESADSTPLEAVTDASGVYTFELSAGSWIIDASHEYSSGVGDSGYTECYSDDYAVTLVDCDAKTVDIQFEECATADKPNLYLYPESDLQMQVKVELGPKQDIVASTPPHGAAGWSGTAHPDGRFTVDGHRHDFLFYEVSLAPWQSRDLAGEEAGWCVQGADPAKQMGEHLAELGFSPREVADFVEAWELDLPAAPGYRLEPLRAVDGMADLVILPHMPVERVWFVVSPDSGGCALPAPEWTLQREGVHGVEWGVVLKGFPQNLGVVY